MSLSILTIEYENGTTTRELTTVSSIYPQRDKIKNAFWKRFKYEVKTKYTVGIITTKNGKFIVGGIEGWIPCHPETQLNDIEIIKIEENPNIKNITQKQEKWTFKSSSSDSIYTVKLVNNTYKCDCAGFWRSKGNCKHVKEVKNGN